MQTVPNTNFADDKQMYYAAKIKLEQAQNLNDLLPFIASLLSIHDLKLLLHKALDTIKDSHIDKSPDKNVKDNTNNNRNNNTVNIAPNINDTDNKTASIALNNNIRSVYMNIGSIDELLPNDVLINILSYLNIGIEYAKLPLISKQFHLLMITYPHIYNNYNIEIVDDPISLIASKKQKTNIQFNIDHKECEIWIGNKFSQNVACGGLEEHIDYIPFPNEDIFKCTFPWHTIKKWCIKCKRRSWSPSSNHIGGNEKIIKIFNRAKQHIRCLNFINPPQSDRVNNQYPNFIKCFSVILNGEIIDSPVNWINSLNKFPALKYLEIGPLYLNYYKTQSKNNRREKYNLIKNIIDKCPKLMAISIIQEDRPKEDIFNINNIHNIDTNNNNNNNNDEEQYIEWIIPSTVEFLQINRVLCNINISYCQNLVGFSVENIKRRQIKFTQFTNEASIDCFICYDDTIFRRGNNDEIGFEESLLPIQFIGYRNDKRNNALKKYFDIDYIDYDEFDDSDDHKIQYTQNQLSPRQIIINYVKKLENNQNIAIRDDIDDDIDDDMDNDEVIANIKCITLGGVDHDLFDLLVYFHWRENENLRNMKFQEYAKWKEINVASWVWRFGKIKSNFSYDNLW